MSSGILYVVATPLGNLEDMTLRAVRVLKEVDLIAAEDTRHSRKLLQHFGIPTAMTSYHDHAERDKAPRLVAELLAGKSVALISDAGTPAISDPGYHLVRAAIAAGVRVEPVPGASAVVAALSVSGLATDRFVFEGFVPAKAAARLSFLADLKREPRTIVVYEAARRLSATLADVQAAMGDRTVVVAREMTKHYEEFLRGPASVVGATIAQRELTQELPGEVTLLIEGAADLKVELDESEIDASIGRLRQAGDSTADIARAIADQFGINRRDAYQRVLRAIS